jgi:hypothetical protein
MGNQQKHTPAFNYNFHNILKIKSNVELGTPFFEVDDVEPDLIVMVVNDFEASKSNSMIRVGKNYWGGYNENYIYYCGHVMKQKSKLYICNINNHERTIVLCNKNYYQYVKLPLVFSLPFTVVAWKAAWVKALYRGFTFQHSACIASGQDGVLMLGFSNTGKSRTIFSCLLRSNDLKYLSDDATLLDSKGYAYSNFTRVSARLLKSLGFSVPLKSKIGILLEDIMFPPISYFIGPLKSTALNVEDVLDKSRIQERAKVKAILFLERGKDKMEELDKDEAIDKMLLQTREGLAPHFSQVPILIYYSYFNSDFSLYELADIERKIVTKVVENSNCFILRSNNGDFVDLVMRIISRI